jgi:YcxB-like protein
MTLEYTSKREDLAALLSCSLERSPKTRVLILCQSAFAGFLWIIGDVLAKRSISPRTWITGGLIAIVTTFLFPILFTLTNKRAKRTLTIDSEKISTRVGRKSGEIRWTSVGNLWVTDDYIFIVGKNLNGFAVPRRAFLQETDRTHFIRLCDEYWRHRQAAS